MKLLKKIIVVYIALLVLSFIVQSCCQENYRIVGNGEIGAYTDYYYPGNEIDTISSSFMIAWHLEMRSEALATNFGLIQSVTATSCGENYLNEIVESSFTISCDRDFKYNGLTIPANSDFSGLNNLEIYIGKLWGSVDIRFSEKFIELADFDKSDYKFKVNIKSNDHLEFENTLLVHMNLN